MKALRIAIELKVISTITVAVASYLWTHSVLTSVAILVSETIASLAIQTLWLNKVHKI